jgi:glucose-6-phosphate 1-dehydrogenase
MTTPTIIILVGITGDLSKRKLLPAIAALKEKDMLPEQFRLVGVTRKSGVVVEGAEMFQMDLDSAADYGRLKEHLESIEKEWGTPAQRLFYLSVAPTVSLPIIEQLDAAGLSKIVNTKLLLEKPFGTDQENGTMLVHNIGNYFVSEQVYRIDHYLAKQSVRNLTQQHIEKEGLEKIEVVAFEKIALEGRADFYEQTGALRDFIQSHLLEVLATMLAVTPSAAVLAAPTAAQAVNPRLKVLQQLFVPPFGPLSEYVKRAQYEGYREDAHNPDSMTETFVSVTLQSSDPALREVSMTLKTGKALERKVTEIRLSYKNGNNDAIMPLDDQHNAYEHVFADAMAGNKEFFVSPEEVLENWRIVAAIQEAWKQSTTDLFFYKQGSGM